MEKYGNKNKSKIQRKKQSKKTSNNWKIVAKKMSGILDDKTAEHLLQSSREFRDGFIMRDIEDLMNKNEQKKS